MDMCLHRGGTVMCYIKCTLEEAMDCHKTVYIIWSEWITGQRKVRRHSCNPCWNTN